MTRIWQVTEIQGLAEQMAEQSNADAAVEEDREEAQADLMQSKESLMAMQQVLADKVMHHADAKAPTRVWKTSAWAGHHHECRHPHIGGCDCLGGWQEAQKQEAMNELMKAREEQAQLRAEVEAIKAEVRGASRRAAGGQGCIR